jgi:hypothetical protein
MKTIFGTSSFAEAQERFWQLKNGKQFGEEKLFVVDWSCSFCTQMD